MLVRFVPVGIAIAQDERSTAESEKVSPSISPPVPPPGLATRSLRSGPERAFIGIDLSDLAEATDPQISLHGRRIAYVRQTNDIMADRE